MSFAKLKLHQGRAEEEYISRRKKMASFDDKNDYMGKQLNK